MLINLLRSPENGPLISRIISPGWHPETAKTLVITFKNGEQLAITLIDFQQGEFQTLLNDCANKKSNAQSCRCTNACNFKPIKHLITLHRISLFFSDPLSKNPLFPPAERIKNRYSPKQEQSMPFSYPTPFAMSSEQTNAFDQHESTILIYPERPFLLDEITTRRIDKSSIIPAKLVFLCQKVENK